MTRPPYDDLPTYVYVAISIIAALGILAAVLPQRPKGNSPE